ncbi:MAG: hypothetical protein A2W19_04265 [Spirochaetes bacterium RBG_16_49_21]|nr:MAG: hypothetical protein A2W19_04265 [Spirochaetes bacterium RBG_16_49_21]
MTGIKKILLATNIQYQDDSIPLPDKIASIKKIGLEEVTLIHTVPMGRWADALHDLHVKAKAVEVKKFSAATILRVARDESVSLIAVNLDRNIQWTSGKSLMRKLINSSAFPLLFIIQEREEPSGPGDRELFSHVIFATDWSAASEKALQLLLSFNKILGELEIVNVINRKLTVKDMRELKEKMARTRKKCLDAEIDAEAHVYAGNTPVEILTAAKDYKGTMIFVGGRSKKNPIKRIFTGSSTCKVAENARVPVFVIP